jgi:flagellar basal-body rod modification protein FlgD
MEIPGIRNAADLSVAGAPAGSAAEQGSSDTFGELGRTQFLELFIAQLNNQNPLDPAKNEEFIAQLAQFSSVEGIQNLNESVDQMATAMQSGLALDAASLVGRSVLVPSGQSAFLGAPLSGSIELSDSTEKLMVDVTRPNGELVNRLDLGAADAGLGRFIWDGSDLSGEQAPQGTYRFRAYSDTGGSQREFAIQMPDRVVSVSLGDQGVVANLAGGDSLPAVQIREIQ